MTPSYGFTWMRGAVGRGRTVVAVALALLLLGLALPLTAGAARTTSPLLSVIVREGPGAGSAPERAVRSVGGQIERRLPIIDGFSAQVPAASLPSLARSAGIQAVTPDGSVQLLGAGVDGHDVAADLGSMYNLRTVMGAGEYWNDGWTGKGVDVAVIDSGVAPVDGLATTGKIVYGPDLSWESQTPLRHLDTYGHGTHMAGIIAGRDSGTYQINKGDTQHFLGIAPGARVVSLKVADSQGATDVSQVIAAIDWVVKNRKANGLNIRVLNLSFGTDGTQAYTLDPLTYAVEVAWRSGIVVVVAGGNAGFGSPQLNNPAYDPFVIAVGAADGRGTYGTADDVIASFSSWGDNTRRPDFLAPGKSVVSLRVPGSRLDQSNPVARVGSTPRFFKGSGTSQAAAVVSGAAALVLEQRPSITPDQLKRLLTRSAVKLVKTDINGQGNGMLDLKLARGQATPTYMQNWPRATGTGSLEKARGSSHLVTDGVMLTGERDIFGSTFSASKWAPLAAQGNTWSGGTWNGNTWSGNTWSGNTWACVQWTGNTWSGNTWSGNTWSGNTWSGNTWSGNTWSGNTWSGNTWSGNTWSGNTWSGNTWSGNTWSGNTWSGSLWSSALWGTE